MLIRILAVGMTGLQMAGVVSQAKKLTPTWHDGVCLVFGS